MNNQAYFQLKKQVQAASLLDKTPIRGGIDMAITICMYIATIVLVSKGASPAVTVTLGAVAMIRATYMTHELVHGHYFRGRLNRHWSYLFANIFTGASRSWWEHKHSRVHHNNTNVLHIDGDINPAGGAFAGERHFPYLFHKYQHILFWLLFPLLYPAFFVASLRFVLHRGLWSEVLLILLHLLMPVLFFLTYGLISVLLLYAVYSVWFSLALVISHLGMAVISEQDHQSGCRLQTESRTTRNIKGGRLVGWIFGGGNAHIEHHLFPAASKFNLPRIKRITRDHFQAMGLNYCEQSAPRIYREIFIFLLNNRAP